MKKSVSIFHQKKEDQKDNKTEQKRSESIPLPKLDPSKKSCDSIKWCLTYTKVVIESDVDTDADTEEEDNILTP